MIEVILGALSFLQEYSTAFLLVAGLFSFVTYVFGKLIMDEMPPTNPSSKETEFLTGLSFFVRLFYAPIVTLLMLSAIFTAFKLLNDFSGLSLQGVYDKMWVVFDLVVLIVQSYLLKFIDTELKNYLARLDFFEKHEEYSKNKVVQIWSYLWTPFSVVMFIILVYAHIGKSFELLDLASLVANGMVVLLIFFSTALIHGQHFPKPKIFVYTNFEKKPIEAFFIRWENESVRVVPRDSASLVIPKSNITKIVYLKREQEKEKPATGFVARVKRISACIQKCIQECY